MNVMDLAGVHAPIPTPFADDGRIALPKLRSLFLRWLASPLSGFVVLGTTGEAALLNDDESDAVVSATRELVPRHQRFVVGTGRESTAATIAATRRASQLGADAVLVRTPGFFKAQMTTDILVHHYTAVAEASPVPVFLYNFPAVTGVNLQPAAVELLARHPNIVGVKESGGDIGQIAEFVTMTPAGFQVLAGSAATFLAALSVGATGGILALSCVLPDACCELYHLTRSGRAAEALTLQHRLMPIARLLGSAYGVPGLKAAMRLAGLDAGLPRQPLMPVPVGGVTAIGAALVEFEHATHRSSA
jgi:4-hydroxy-2-oxoglutarate aldolase